MRRILLKIKGLQAFDFNSILGQFNILEITSTSDISPNGLGHTYVVCCTDGEYRAENQAGQANVCHWLLFKTECPSDESPCSAKK